MRRREKEAAVAWTLAQFRPEVRPPAAFVAFVLHHAAGIALEEVQMGLRLREDLRLEDDLQHIEVSIALEEEGITMSAPEVMSALTVGGLMTKVADLAGSDFLMRWFESAKS